MQVSFSISQKTLERLEWPRILDRLAEFVRTPQALARLHGQGSDGQLGTALFEPSAAAVRERLHYLTTSLDETTQLMDELDLDTASYRELLIRATGNVTTDILDPDVAASLLQTLWQSTTDWLVSTAPQFAFKLVLFAITLVVFRFLAQIAKVAVAQAVA